MKVASIIYLSHLMFGRIECAYHSRIDSKHVRDQFRGKKRIVKYEEDVYKALIVAKMELDSTAHNTHAAE